MAQTICQRLTLCLRLCFVFFFFLRKYIGESILKFLTSVKNELHPVDGIAPKPQKLYPEKYNRLVKVFQIFEGIILPVGQKQLIRQMIGNTLNVIII